MNEMTLAQVIEKYGEHELQFVEYGNKTAIFGALLHDGAICISAELHEPDRFGDYMAIQPLSTWAKLEIWQPTYEGVAMLFDSAKCEEWEGRE